MSRQTAAGQATVPSTFTTTALEAAVLSHAERRRFDAISRALAADPDIAAATRRAARRHRRRRVFRWLAPYWVAALEARYARRMLAQGG